MNNPLIHEEALYQAGFLTVGGVDEAGRGPLAGPVVASAVILPRGLVIEGVDDSKKLTAKRRSELAAVIKETALSYAIGYVDCKTVDTINILQATLLAMRYAVETLTVKPDALIIDGLQAPKLDKIYTVCLPYGDTLSHSCAAASIIAKTERDAIMVKIHEQYPHYGFNIHKGYGTKAHINAIKEFGLCPQHRVSFKIKGLACIKSS